MRTAMARRIFLIASLLVMMGCSSSPNKSGSSNSSLPQTTAEVPLDCGGSNFKAMYSAQSRSMPAMVSLTYRGQQPMSSELEASLRRCMEKALAEKTVTGDLMGNVWWSATGREDDDALQDLADGSRFLIIKSGTREIISDKQKDGVTTKTTDSANYFVEYEELKRAVKPYDTYARFDVVFKEDTSKDAAYSTLIKEMKRIVGKQKVPLETMGVGLVGTETNPAGRRQIGSPGNYVYVNFDPKRHGNQLVDIDGRSLGPAAVISR
jgi:hypothetical protein